MKKRTRAFTLIELSISIIIIGLLIGGITAGSSLVKTAAVRSIISEYETFQTAIVNFKSQYGALPGDFSKASNFWPSCDVTPANCNGN